MAYYNGGKVEEKNIPLPGKKPLPPKKKPRLELKKMRKLKPRK